MSINIKATKILVRGDLEGVAIYLRGRELCFSGYYERKLLTEGYVYDLEEFNEILDVIKKASEKLAEINKQLALEKEKRLLFSSVS